MNESELKGDDSVTRLGDFLNFLGINFLTKVAQKFNAILG